MRKAIVTISRDGEFARITQPPSDERRYERRPSRQENMRSGVRPDYREGGGNTEGLLFARLQAGTFDDFDSRARRTGHIEVIDRRTVRQVERLRLAGELHALTFEHGFRVVDRG